MTTSAQASKPIAGDRNKWFALVVLLAGAFMALLDTTIVNVAIPTIRTSLDASNATLSWIISGYALAFGLALIPAGRVGDRLGHKWVFVAGLTLFTVASLACGLAQDDIQLIAARAVQGLAGGIFFTTITALIQLMFTARERGRAFAILGATIGFSTALGPLAGGLIIQAFGAESGWRLVFMVNIPVGILAVIAAAVVLPGGAENARGGGDWLGLVLLTAGLLALLTPLIEGQQENWPWWTYASMAGGTALIALFALWERRLEKTNGSPLVPPRLFRHRAFTGGVVLALVYFAAFTSIFFTIALLWQVGLAHTALQSGLVAMPFAIGSIIGASQSDILAVRFGRNVLVVGLGMVAVGITAVWLGLALWPPTEYNGWQLLAPLFVAGIGSGLFIAPNASFIVATVERADAGAASGVIGTMQRIGSAIGIAVIGTVLFGTLHVVPGRDALATAFGHSATLAMGISAVLSVAAFGLVFALPRAVDPSRLDDV
ncbi:MFS transporter [Mycolicibacterium moriokaense]|uniref:EmrB/QacA subfamily drug resistance transporter n=1 Tax=Mycolicibacterium moriokaense TaxID=39691 RepID=A0A318H7G8_9MYCO|nr:MFS transporter [Mycolicibacterium moriokaense]PXX00912.1 EmrB/QacA subfamily drug resistance transporter [Mycolicibacterium moriokaense]